MIRNFTPHVINIVDGPSIPSDGVARCTQQDIPVAVIDGVQVTHQVFGDVVGLPDPQDGVFLIVSRLVAAACPDRKDLLVPGPLVRDNAGQPIGCRGLAIADNV